MLSDKDFAELRAEFNQALPDIIAGKLDRTDLMLSSKRIARGQVTMDEVIGAASQETGVQVGAITGQRANASTSNARTLAIMLIRDLRPDLSTMQIARKFKRDWTTVGATIKRAEKLLNTDANFSRHYQHTRWRLGLAA